MNQEEAMYFNKSLFNGKPECDLCGTTPNPDKEILRTDQSICLCTDCSCHFEAIPEKIGESVERFLIGNVL